MKFKSKESLVIQEVRVARKKSDKQKSALSRPDSEENLLNKSANTIKKAAIGNPMPAADGCPSVSRHERIELLAYSYWIQRGCQGGSPDEDWFRAEREISRESSS